MKFLKNISLMALISVFAISCADEDLSPIVTFDNVGKGGYPRLVLLEQGEYDLQDPDNSAFVYTVEFVTIDKGANVDSYSLFVNLNGGDYTQHLTFGQSDFTDSERGFRSIRVSLDFPSVASTLGVSPASLVSGDQITLDTRVTLSDGITYTSDNSSAAVNGAAFQGFFRPVINVTCPLPDDVFVGDYVAEYTDYSGGFGDFFNLGATDNILTRSLVAGSTTNRTINFDYDGFGFVQDWPINFGCDQVTASNYALGASCGSGDITARNAGGTFDILDDTEFTFSIEETDDGGCGFGTGGLIEVTMTKM